MTSIAERVKAATNAARERRVVLPVPLAGSPITLLCRTLTQDEIGRAQDLGKRMSPKNTARASLIVSKDLLARACTEIWVDGETWLDEAGDPLTFDDKALHSALGVADRLDAVAEVVGRDGDMEVMSDALLRESGYTRDDYSAGEPDPTT